jgi:hypothetical protein
MLRFERGTLASPKETLNLDLVARGAIREPAEQNAARAVYANRMGTRCWSGGGREALT